jgi:hypothetical protein
MGTNKEAERKVTGTIHIRGEIQTKLASDALHKHDIERAEDQRAANKQFNVAIATLVGIAAYTIITALQWHSMSQANHLSRVALVDVQRAFVVPGVPSEVLIKDLRINSEANTRKIAVLPVTWGNSGATQAPTVIGFSTYELVPHNDVAAMKFVVPPNTKLTSSFLGPHTTITTNTMTIPLEDFLSFSDPQTAMYGNTIVIWGWLAYRDIFPDTNPHVAEFCYTLASIERDASRGNNPTNLGVNFSQCPTHNCTDERCDDYKVLTTYVAK